MKFSEIQYERPDVKAVIARYEALAEKAGAAKNAKEQLDCVDEHERLLSEVATMMSYVYIRHSVDTRDPSSRKSRSSSTRIIPFLRKTPGVLHALLDSRSGRSWKKRWAGCSL
jgi:hypothetical protein